MAKLAGQKLRASYVTGTTAGQKLLASDVTTATVTAGGTPKASQF
jgi:hypothetical protein